MINNEDRFAEAYRAGKQAGHRMIAKQSHNTSNPYADQTLRETWSAGFNDGIDEAIQEEN